MFRQYRVIEPGEFFVIAGDCSQGGPDYNACQFMSKSKLDIPLVYHAQGVAAQMTRAVHPVIERIYDVTGVKPTVAFETANGGASEMDTLNVLNKQGKYDLFKMPSIGRDDLNTSVSKILGYVTSGGTRPILVGDLKGLTTLLFVLVCVCVIVLLSLTEVFPPEVDHLDVVRGLNPGFSEPWGQRIIQHRQSISAMEEIAQLVIQYCCPMMH